MSEKELMSDIRNCVNAWVDREAYLEALKNIKESKFSSLDLAMDLTVELIAGLLEEIDMEDVADLFREVML